MNYRYEKWKDIMGTLSYSGGVLSKVLLLRMTLLSVFFIGFTHAAGAQPIIGLGYDSQIKGFFELGVIAGDVDSSNWSGSAEGLLVHVIGGQEGHRFGIGYGVRHFGQFGALGYSVTGVMARFDDYDKLMFGVEAGGVFTLLGVKLYAVFDGDDLVVGSAFHFSI